MVAVNGEVLGSVPTIYPQQSYGTFCINTSFLGFQALKGMHKRMLRSPEGRQVNHLFTNKFNAFLTF